MMSLTDDWKEGRLEGDYWVKLIKPTGEYIERTTIAKGGIPYNKDPCVVILEVLARCDYDHLVELTEKAEDLKKDIEYLRRYQTIQNDDIGKLRNLLRKCKPYIDKELEAIKGAGFCDCDWAWKTKDLLTRINSAIGENVTDNVAEEKVKLFESEGK